jgi:hypothetical protein
MGISHSCFSFILSVNKNELNNNLNLTKIQIEEINSIWEIILCQSNGAQEIGVRAFKGLFLISPESFQLFYSFNKLSDWEISQPFLHHCATVTKVLRYIVKVISNPILLEKNIDYMVCLSF